MKSPLYVQCPCNGRTFNRKLSSRTRTRTRLLIFWCTLPSVWTRTLGFQAQQTVSPTGSPCPVVSRVISSGLCGLGPRRSAPRTAPAGQGRGVVSMETSARAGVSRARSRAAGAAASRDPGSGPGCAPPALTLHLQALDQPLCRAEPAGRVSAAAPPFWVLLPFFPQSWGRPLCSAFPGTGELLPADLRGTAGEPGRGSERDLGVALD